MFTKLWHVKSVWITLVTSVFIYAMAPDMRLPWYNRLKKGVCLMGKDRCEQHDSYLPKPEYVHGAASGEILIDLYLSLPNITRWIRRQVLQRINSLIIACDGQREASRKIFLTPWASYQIRKIVGCACAGNAGNVSPPPTSKETAS